jgi:hypothetical protein
LLAAAAFNFARAAETPSFVPDEVTTLSLQVEPQSETCFHQDVAASQRVEATVLVFRGGKLDVSLRIEGPAGGAPLYERLLHANIDDTTGMPLPTIVRKGHSFAAPSAGVYTFCISNKMARWTAKVLEFQVRLSAGGAAAAAPALGDVVKAAAPGAAVPEGVLTEDDGAAAGESAASHLSTMRGFAFRLQQRAWRVMDDAVYHRMRSDRHHDTLLSTERRVAAWTLAECAAVVAFALAQVLVVRAWFSEPDGGAPMPSSRGGGGLAGWGGATSARSGGSLASARLLPSMGGARKTLV